MRFKDWFHKEEYGGIASGEMLQGGRSDLPAARLNTNMPVQSKLSCKDGSDKPEPDAYDDKVKPDQLFHFRSPADKNATRERQSQWIDRSRRKARFVSVPPDTIY
jgi:hypothetical protein